MTITKEQQKMLLAALLGTIVLMNGYRFLAEDAPKIAPLVYERGTKASTPVRHGLQSRSGGADPLAVYLNLSKQNYPGVTRDIFRMQNPQTARPKTTPVVVVTAPTVPAGPQKTPEEIAADQSRANLLKFKYLGYLVEKDMTLFLSNSGELFVVKVGDKVLATYAVKEANKDFVVILDTITRVEGRVPLSGEETQFQQSLPSPNPKQQTQQQAPNPTQQQTMQPAQQAAPSPPQPTRQQRAQQERYQKLKQDPSSK